MSARHLFSAVACLCAATVLTAAQVFRAGTDTVLLSVTVSDGRGRPVSGLTREDFRVFEDGLPQNLDFFAADPQPISLSILFDASTSMETKLGVAQEAAVGFCRRLRPGDVAQVITFNTTTEIAQPFTSDIDALEHAIRTTRTGGSTALYNSMYIALTELKRATADSAGTIRRQAIILLSDGADTASVQSAEAVLDLAAHSNVAIYEVALRDRDSARTVREYNESDYVIRTLAQSTGGRLFYVNDVAQLPAIYAQIADELANQYVLGYTSRNAKRDGAWRQVAIRTARPETVARTKSGYYGPTKGR